MSKNWKQSKQPARPPVRPVQQIAVAVDPSKGCENCGAKPIVPETGMCGPCTFGEAETAGGNW